MTMGTDTGVHRHEDAPKQLAYMVRYGMTPMHALQAATVNGADAIGLAGQIGTIAPSAYADIIAVRGDPLADVSLLENVGFVMKGGKVYKGP
jgi:imidazolonepropionase-like amidohydrolase